MKQASILVVIVLILLTACAHRQMPNPWSDMTHKQRSTWMNGIYNAQYDDYLVAVAKPDLTKDECDMLHSKKKHLTELWPLLMDYSHYADTGQVPPEAVEMQVIKLINLLIE